MYIFCCVNNLFSFGKICVCIVGFFFRDIWRFLEDGLGIEDWYNCYDDSFRRKVKGKKMYLLDNIVIY